MTETVTEAVEPESDGHEYADGLLALMEKVRLNAAIGKETCTAMGAAVIAWVDLFPGQEFPFEPPIPTDEREQRLFLWGMMHAWSTAMLAGIAKAAGDEHPEHLNDLADIACQVEIAKKARGIDGAAASVLVMGPEQ